MSKLLVTEITRLKEELVRLGDIVEQQVREALEAENTCNASLATKIIERDNEIDHSEVRLEEECLKLLALHQPVAIDLRLIVSVLKINDDLERIADLAVNIAERAVRLAELRACKNHPEIQAIALKSKQMLRECLYAFVELDLSIAKHVLTIEDEVDALYRDFFRKAVEGMKASPELAEEWVLYLSIAKQLEQISDLSGNIAQDVIYLLEGEIVRHKR